MHLSRYDLGVGPGVFPERDTFLTEGRQKYEILKFYSLPSSRVFALVGTVS